MRFIADLHIHSHFSRATSRDLDPENLARWAQKKGLAILGSGDFTHPGWVEELRAKLVAAENGLYRLRPDLEEAIQKELPDSCRSPVRFLLSGEISCIYKRDGQTRKIHHLILMPDFEAVIRLNRALERVGNIRSDGRPILGMDSRDLIEMTLDASDKAFFIPAHVWTPWFSLFGSKSGFNAIEECFADLTPHIHALETGLSSDPAMNRLLSALDDYLLVSNSDAHSPSRLGREANILETELDYEQILKAMISKDGFKGTIEFYPEEGKYHLDGHRKCLVRMDPEDTMRHKGICPLCGKALTIGVLNRVSELSDREAPKILKDFYSLIPLSEILSETLCCGAATKKAESAYEDLLSILGPELAILMEVPLQDIEDAGGILLATAIDRMRKGRVIREAGYDGEYGVIRLFHKGEMADISGQKSLFAVRDDKTAGNKKPLTAKGERVKKHTDPAGREKVSFSDAVITDLNPEQKDAVMYSGGHLLIVAGPGTGKTMTLTHRIVHMIRSNTAKPEQILALTFTNKATGEMRDRIDSLLPEDRSGSVHVTTFHGLCLELLRNEAGIMGLPPSFNICSEQDSSVIARQVISDAGKGKRTAARLLKELPRMKRSSVIENDTDAQYQSLFPLFEKYQKRLRDLGMLDLDDLEVETLSMFKGHPELSLKYAGRFPYIFVDEYQDTNRIQSAILKEIVKQGMTTICAIGDPDQAIYGFRGADVANFHNFAKDFPGAKEISLLKNYRSTEVILKGSSSVMDKKRPLEAISGKGGSIHIGTCLTHSEEAEMVVEQIERLMGGITLFSIDSERVSSHEDGEGLGFGDIAALYRINSQGDGFEEAFSRAGLPYVRSGERALIDQYPVNIIWRFLQLLRYPDNNYCLMAYKDLLVNNDMDKGKISMDCPLEGSLEEVIDHVLMLHEFDLTSGEAGDAVLRLRETAQKVHGDIGAFLDKLSLDRTIDHTALPGDRIALMSLHAAKGLEWPVVFITGCEDRLIPCSLFGDYDKAEEKRLFYVGMTRARRRLILSHAQRRKINGRTLDMKPSPFLSLIPGPLCGPLERAPWKRKGKRYKQLELFCP
ncbi:MAG TPA: UvrD-helicase domain-containing protein [Desulfatiglandales bacterium]|nr:UvrD-helicase domain-containing protein [Desulfatiglandales bacterium]